MGLFDGIWDAIEGFFEDTLNNIIINPLTTLFHYIVDPISNIVTDIINKVNDFITLVLILFNCTMALFNFISAVCIYIGAFATWVLMDFLPWTGQYFQCTLKIIFNLRICMFWYVLDTIIYTFCIVPRFIIWLIGLEDLVNEYFWNLLEKLDKYIHDDGPGNLGTGYHIIHFPDSVKEECYTCHIQPIAHNMPSTCDLTKKYSEFINCRDPQNPKKCKSKINKFFEKSSSAVKSNSINAKPSMKDPNA